MNPRLVNLQWGDGEYPFALNIGQIRELEAVKNIGIGALYERLISGAWYGDDAYHIIRLGLIGGGMTPTEALRKCETYVLDRPFAEGRPFALTVLRACLFGVQDEKKEPVGESATASPPTE